LCGNLNLPANTNFWWELLDINNNKARVANSAETDCSNPGLQTGISGRFGPIDTGYKSSVVTDLRADVHFCGYTDGHGVEIGIKREMILQQDATPRIYLPFFDART
jgi:hypothetical protein